MCLQEEFYQLAREFSQKIYPMDLALEILRSPENYASKHLDASFLEQKAEEYRKLFEMASKTMKEKYTFDTRTYREVLQGSYLGFAW